MPPPPPAQDANPALLPASLDEESQEVLALLSRSQSVTTGAGQLPRVGSEPGGGAAAAAGGGRAAGLPTRAGGAAAGPAGADTDAGAFRWDRLLWCPHLCPCGCIGCCGCVWKTGGALVQLATPWPTCHVQVHHVWPGCHQQRPSGACRRRQGCRSAGECLRRATARGWPRALMLPSSLRRHTAWHHHLTLPAVRRTPCSPAPSWREPAARRRPPPSAPPPTLGAASRLCSVWGMAATTATRRPRRRRAQVGLGLGVGGRVMCHTVRAAGLTRLCCAFPHGTLLQARAPLGSSPPQLGQLRATARQLPLLA
jgi:hypothetical protein